MDFFSLRQHRNSGSQLRFDCPKCGDTKGHLYVSPDLRSWICFKCDWRGRNVGHKKPVTDNPLELRANPFQTEERRPYRDPLIVENTSQRLVDYLEGRRLILPDTLLISLLYDKRLALKCHVIDSSHGSIFWNLRDCTGLLEQKVLFMNSNIKGVAKKSDCVLWSPLYQPRSNIVPVVCEGDFSAWSVYSKDDKYSYIGLATLGKTISTTQVRYLKRFKEIFYMPDADVPLHNVRKNLDLLKLTGQKIYIFDRLIYEGRTDDANDLSKRYGNKWFNRRMFKPVI